MSEVDKGFEAELRAGLFGGAVAEPIRAYPSVEARVESSIEPALAARWDELALRVSASPYLRPGWIAAWWRAFGAGRLEIRTLERDGRLVALLPLARRHGVLRSVTNPHSPEFGLLAENRIAALELASTIFRIGAPRRVAIASLDPNGRGLDACQQAAREAGFRTLVRPYQLSPYLRIEGEWEPYEASLSSSFTAGLRRSRRQLERMGSVSIEIASGREGLDSLLTEAFAVESSGWKGARGTAIRAHQHTRQFYTEVARWAVERNLLRLFFLRLDDRPLAMYFALEQDGVVYLLKGGYDPAYSRVSPGKLLLHRVVAEAFHNGASRIEFHGGADAYKLRWSETVRGRVLFEAFANSPAGRLDWGFFQYGRPAVKRVLPRPIAKLAWSLMTPDRNRGSEP